MHHFFGSSVRIFSYGDPGDQIGKQLDAVKAIALSSPVTKVQVISGAVCTAADAGDEFEPACGSILAGLREEDCWRSTIRNCLNFAQELRRHPRKCEQLLGGTRFARSELLENECVSTEIERMHRALLSQVAAAAEVSFEFVHKRISPDQFVLRQLELAAEDAVYRSIAQGSAEKVVHSWAAYLALGDCHALSMAESLRAALMSRMRCPGSNSVEQLILQHRAMELLEGEQMHCILSTPRVTEYLDRVLPNGLEVIRTRPADDRKCSIFDWWEPGSAEVGLLETERLDEDNALSLLVYWLLLTHIPPYIGLTAELSSWLAALGPAELFDWLKLLCSRLAGDEGLQRDDVEAFTDSWLQVKCVSWR